VELNPHDSANWLDLAEVLYVTGDGVEEKSALANAVAADPTTPEVAWNAGNLYLLQEDVPAARSLFKIVLNSDPALVPLTLKTLWGTEGSVSPIIAMMPPEPTAYVNFIGLLASQNERESAAQVWQKLIELNRPFDYRPVLFYVEDLLAWRNVAAAKAAWQQLGERNEAFRAYQPQRGNLVVNSSFENEFLNAGFDWRSSSQATKVTVDDETSKSGEHAALVTYSTPVLDSGLFQLVPVEPNSAYKATAWLKTEELQTANGPRLTLTDAYNGTLLGASEPAAYTTPWKQVTVDFKTGPETVLVAVRLSRDRQETVVRGRLWIDDVEIQFLADHVSSK
jgi:tetratricopeptide (TPR) repeat protein